eukprot:5485766-Pyramimonas_sp.AAC.1
MDTEDVPPVVTFSGAVLVGKTRFRTRKAELGKKHLGKTHHRYFKAEVENVFRASHRDINHVRGKQMQYGEITHIFGLDMGRREEQWVFIRADWFQPLACKVDPKTHNVVVDRSYGWWGTQETVMLAQNITAQ